MLPAVEVVRVFGWFWALSLGLKVGFRGMAQVSSLKTAGLAVFVAESLNPSEPAKP